MGPFAAMMIGALRHFILACRESPGPLGCRVPVDQGALVAGGRSRPLPLSSVDKSQQRVRVDMTIDGYMLIHFDTCMIYDISWD